MKRIVSSICVGISLLLFVVICIEEAVRFPDNDFSLYWGSNGKMISVDTFEDLPYSNAITVRQFSGLPADVPCQFLQCSLEGGNETPSAGIGGTVDLSLDEAGQPVSRGEVGAKKIPARVKVLLQIPLNAGLWLMVAAIAPLTLVTVRYRQHRKRQSRLQTGLCSNCGYDIRATPERCPECGAASR